MCDNYKFLDESKKIFLSETDKNIIKNSEIYEIQNTYPGTGFHKWKESEGMTIYSNNNNILKIYCQPQKQNFIWS